MTRTEYRSALAVVFLATMIGVNYTRLSMLIKDWDSAELNNEAMLKLAFVAISLLAAASRVYGLLQNDTPARRVVVPLVVENLPDAEAAEAEPRRNERP